MSSPDDGAASMSGATDSDPVSVDASTMGRHRSTQQSEAQQLERCKKAVEQCRADLADLRAACKGANAHREKCAELLGAATEAVVALEDILYDQNVNLRGLRMLKQMSGRVQTAMDQGETVVKVYGTMSGLMKLASKVCSPGIPLKFADATSELRNLAKQARLVLTHPPLPLPLPSQPISTLPAGRMVSGSSTALDGMVPSSSAGARSNQPPVMGSHKSGMTVSPGSASTPVSGAVSGATQLGLEAASTGTYLVQPDTAAAGAPASGAPLLWGDRAVPEEALQETQIHKGGGKKQMVTAMVHVPAPPDRPGHLGHLWYFLAKTFGTSTLLIWDLSARVETEVREGRQGQDMTCMHYDDGVIWSGHRSGGIRVWDAMKQESLITSVHKAFNTPVSAITTDENGLCWAGSDKGRVRCFRLHQELHSITGVHLGFHVVQRGELLTTDKGVPRPAQNSVERSEEGFIKHPLLREAAHLGPVRSIAAAAGRVWTWGGSTAFVSFKEWFQDGWPHGKIGGQVVRSAGPANDMVFVSPVALVKEALKVQSQMPAGAGNPTSSTMLNSFSPSASVTAAGRVTSTQHVEVPMAWQMLTAHNDGMVQVWGIVNETLTPLVRLGSRAAPILRIVICESLGILATAHSDGTLRLWELAHPRSVSGFEVLLQNEEQKTRASTMPFASLQISRSGLADAVGGVLGVVTASCSASIKHLPAHELRNAAKKAGLKVLGDLASNDPSQWPVSRFSSWQVAQAVVELEQQYSSDMMEARAGPAMHLSDHDVNDNAERSALSIDTNSWIIDWKDLSRSRVIGEGAFGKVWLGRWQETDVAIKQLGSLSALGVQTGSLVHDSSGGIKLDQDVQRALDKEVGLLKNMRHPNIILFMGVVLEPPAVVTEFCSRGSLYDLLKEARDKPALAKALTWERRIVMALDAAKGMLYLHGHKPQPIIHRDLKSPNLLVEKNWRVKVTDFNLSRQAKTHSEIASVQSVVANNPRWQPPEVIMHQQYNKTTDVYAFGLIMWELLTWQMPFPHLSNFQIIMAVTQQGQRPAVKDQWAAAEYPGGTFCAYDEYVELMNRCWAEHPAARPNFEQIIADLRMIAEKVLRETRGLGRGDSRLPPRAGGPMMLPSGSRNFARYAAQVMASLPPAAAASGNGRVPAPAPGTPTTYPGMAVAAAAAVGAEAAAAGAAAAQQSSSRSTVASAGGGTQYSDTTEPPISATTSGSYLPGAPSGGSANSAGPPATSPRHASPARAAGVSMSSNAAMAGGPFGGRPAPWMQQAAPAGTNVSSGGPPPPPSPFGGAPAPAGGQTISSAAAPPPSPFGGAAPAAAAGQTISSAAAPPPSPFGGGAPAAAAAARGQTISSAAAPPPSPFGNAAPAAAAAAGVGQTISSAAPPPPSPFGGGAPQIMSSAATPPPSPFGSAAPQTMSSAAPPPPSPFGSAAPQTMSSAAPPPPSPFGSAAPQIMSSAAPPPPSPFGSAAPQIMSSAAPPPPSPFGGGSVPAAAGQPVRPPSPFDVRLPQDVPEPRHHIHEVPASMPSTVMEASASAEAAAAAAAEGAAQDAVATGVPSPPAGSTSDGSNAAAAARQASREATDIRGWGSSTSSVGF